MTTHAASAAAEASHHRKVLLLAVFVLISPAAGSEAAAAAAPSQQSQWISTNPGGGGAFNSPIITQPSGFWAVGSDLSGLYLSRDSGATWQVLGAAAGLTATHIACLAPHPAGKLLLGTDKGIFTAGEDGSGMRQTYPSGYVSAITVSDANPDVVFAAVHPEYNALKPALLRSGDGGGTWQRVAAANLPDSLRVLGLRIHPVDFDAVVVLSGIGRFASGPAQAFLSIDAGQTFDRLGWQFDPGLNITDISYSTDANNLNKMFLTMFRDRERGASGSLHVSTDAGGSWAKVADHTGVILLDGATSSHLRLLEMPYQRPDDGTWEGDALLWETWDDGVSWTPLHPEDNMLVSAWSTGYKVWGMGSGFQGQTQSIGWDAKVSNLVLWADSQFVYASTNGGRSWSFVTSNAVTSGKGVTSWRSRGIDNAVPAVVVPSPASSAIVYAGYFDMGLFRSDNGGLSWVPLHDPRFSGTWAVAVGGNTLSVVADPSRPAVVWAQLGGDLQGSEKFLVRSVNKGTNWTRITAGLPARISWLQGLSIDPSSRSGTRRLFLIADRAVYRSTNDGLAWSKVLDCPGCQVTAVLKGAAWAGGSGGLWRSAAAGAAGSWTKVAGLPTNGWTADKTPLDWGMVGLTDLTVAKDGAMWAAVLGVGFYRSNRQATSWTLIRRDPFARSVAADATSSLVFCGSSSALYAGGYDPSSAGVMVFDGTSWRQLNAGLAWPFATLIRVVNGARWVVSPGQGVLRWQQ